MGVEDGSPRRFEIVIDGVTYRVVAQKAGQQGYLDSWRCMACTESATSTLRDDSLEEGIRLAELLVRDHHQRVHTRKAE